MTTTPINVGVVGATGMVGEVFLSLLKERAFPVGELRLFASDRSQGSRLKFGSQDVAVQMLSESCFAGLDLVFFSSGDDISREWAPKAAAAGAVAIDNSAAFRMDPSVPLIVPEVNPELIPQTPTGCLIANPNCSTIQLVVALKPLADRFGLKSIKVASYQAVSGAGRPAQQELMEQTKNYFSGQKTFTSNQFAHPMVFNCVPQIGAFGEDGLSSEERKIRLETRKILALPQLQVSAFTVRVPVLNAHSEAIWVELLDQSPAREELLHTLKAGAGLKVIDSLQTSHYPMATDASGTDPVYVGRIHQDPDDPNTWQMWVVADNLRKGAALNGIQIAEHIWSVRKK